MGWFLRSVWPGTLALVVLAVVACSDDVKPASDAARDRGRDLAMDRSSLDARLLDQRVSDTRPDTRPRDSRPLDGKPAFDLKPALDKPADKAQADLGKSKLLIWTICSSNPKCKPYCGAIGSKSEGWYDPCTTQLMNHPTGGQPYWDQCASCVVSCDAIGSYSEGWYAHCP